MHKVQCRSGTPMGFLHVEMPPVRSLSCVTLDLQGKSLLPDVVSL